jgi:hypothetical protein
MILDSRGQPIRRCGNPGCGQLATHYVEVLVPPKGGGIERAFRSTIGLMLCLPHAREERVETFLTPQFRLMVASVVASRSRVPPDFERAEVKVRKLDDRRWLETQRAAAEGREGRRRFSN